MLARARERGYLGLQSIERQIDHADGFAEVAWRTIAAGREAAAGTDAREARVHQVEVLDLGAGGGLPGLVLACSPRLAQARFALLEASASRADWLAEAVGALELADRVEVVLGRAEAVGRHPHHRHRYDLVVARSFGRPAVTAECAAPFLVVGGSLIVSEPPEPPSGSSPVPDRWPAPSLAELGFAPARPESARDYRYVVIELSRECPDRYPRRNGVPTKRPLF